MIKIIVVFGTRPEAIKLLPVVKELGKFPEQVRLVVCTTGQHRELLDQMLQTFSVTPDFDLGIMTKNQTLFDIVTKSLTEIKPILDSTHPDLLLVQGDTTTAFACALAAFYEKIPVGHVEAGLRTFDMYYPFPEEMNRKLISGIASLHFAPTENNKKNLLREGVNENSIFVTGNTVIDALFTVLKEKPKESGVGSRESGVKGNNQLKILVTAHRRENFGEPIKNICLALKEIVKRNKNVEIIYPVHPNPNVEGPVYNILSGQERLNLIQPLDYVPFVNLMNDSYLILTDSGGIQEEAPALGKPVLVLRNETERPEAVEAGTVKIIGTRKDKIISAVELLLNNVAEYDRMARAINPYGDGRASSYIVKTIFSFFQAKIDRNFKRTIR
ncbi:MAG TPA: non-hydrolyzing UDP-N-acetylglucosamine 2-epimerase [Candidatus Brocadiia bacterium]|nr:UDP-N-acetylglucosamine 2-epimerase (non-hydrolyzing) [Candidatus Brocadiales bacterium]